MKILRILFLLAGILLLLVGTGAAIVNRTAVGTSYNCQDAERFSKEADEAKKQQESAKDPVTAKAAEAKAKEKHGFYMIASKSCAERNDALLLWFVAFLGVGGLGLVLTASSFFLRRRR